MTTGRINQISIVCLFDLNW